MRTTLVIAILFAGLAACRSAEIPDGVELRTVYDRTDRDFDTGVLYRPDDATEALPQHLLAPLWIVQNGRSSETPPEVTFERTTDGWIYRWWDPDAMRAQGVHATLGADGFPLAYEILLDSSGARLLFVDTTVEESAANEFGTPLPGRRFSVERGLDETPGVAVGGIYEPGPTPLGPFVYLWEETHDVNVVLCRCMAPKVFDIVDSVAYTLKPYDSSVAPAALAEWQPLPLDGLLRLSSN